MPVEDRSFKECPTSMLSKGDGPVIRQLMLEVLDADMVKEATGVFPGGDPNQWPARWYDMVMSARYEKMLVKQSREDLLKK